MTLVFIDQDKLSVSRMNMRYGRKAPDVSDILPTVRKCGVIQTLLVRPNGTAGHFEIVGRASIPCRALRGAGNGRGRAAALSHPCRGR